MGCDESRSTSSSGKHRLASDDRGVEVSSKRRKHHHHHHRRSHRHSSRHGRERNEVVEEASPAAVAAAGSSYRDPVLVDDEREEGEILDEDDDEQPDVNGGKLDVFKISAGSDAETGRANCDGVDADNHLIMHGVEDTMRWKELHPDGGDSDGYTFGHQADNSSKRSAEQEIISDGAGRQKLSKLSKKNEDKQMDIDRNYSKDRTRSRSPVSKESFNSLNHREKNNCKNRASDSDFEMNNTRQNRESTGDGQTLSSGNRSEENNCKNRASDNDSEMLDSRQNMELTGDCKRHSSRNKSISPQSLLDKYRETRSSSYSNRYHEKDQHRHRSSSRSRDHTLRSSYEKSSRPSASGDDWLTAQESVRDDSGRYDRFDDRSDRNRGSCKESRNEKHSNGGKAYDDSHEIREKDRDRDRERNRDSVRDRDNVHADKGPHRARERSSSYSRYDHRKDRHGSRGRDRDRDRHKERNRSSLKDRENVDLHKEVRTERASNNSYSIYEKREDRHVQDRHSGRERYHHNNTSDRASDIRDRYVEKKLRSRRHERDKDGIEGGKNQARDNEVNEHKGRSQSGQIETYRVSCRDRRAESRYSKHDDVAHHKNTSRPEVGLHVNNFEEDKQKPIREEEEGDYQDRIEEQLAKQDEEDVDKIKEESRKSRQAILEKYRSRQQQQVQSTDVNVKASEKDPSDEDKLQGLQATINDNEVSNYDIENGDAYDTDPSFTLGKSPVRTGDSANKRTENARGLGDGSPKSERSVDMFSDDIFGESPAGVCKTIKGEGPQIANSLYDNWDDAEGYYSYRFGEVLDGRYEVVAAHGKGVFSTVVRAKDLKPGKGDPEEVAIKIIRNNETMFKAGQSELVILKKLVGADPGDKRHCVRFISSFKYRNHLCLVFESLHMNLREVLKKFGRNIGLKLTAVRAYAKQLFIALKHLRNCGVLHCDIKPDNMLVNEAKNVLKLCDFGNAMFAGKNEITPYLVSRFYRAPEIILGLPYDHPMDMWSVGCCLYEIYTGKVLFPGPSNNDMLRLHMELKGPFPKKMLRKGSFTDQHFDQDFNFHATEEDSVTKKPIKRLLANIKPKDIGALISSFPGEDPKLLSHFKDLLDRIFVLDPEKRMTVSQALSHPFITACRSCWRGVEVINNFKAFLHGGAYQWDIFLFLGSARLCAINAVLGALQETKEGLWELLPEED